MSRPRGVLGAIVLALTVAATSLLGAGTAEAAPVAKVGPGSGFVTTGGIEDLTLCSIAAVGYDEGGRLVGLTAGHCVLRPGLPVTLTANATAGPVGTTAVSHWGPDYGVVILDPARVAPVSSLGGVTVTEVGNAFAGQEVCKTGVGTGRTCGRIVDDRGGDLLSDAVTLWGDSGGALVAGTTLVGIASHSSATPLASATVYASAAESLRRLNASGGPGAGFRPI